VPFLLQRRIRSNNFSPFIYIHLRIPVYKPNVQIDSPSFTGCTCTYMNTSKITLYLGHPLRTSLPKVRTNRLCTGTGTPAYLRVRRYEDRGPITLHLHATYMISASAYDLQPTTQQHPLATSTTRVDLPVDIQSHTMTNIRGRSPVVPILHS